MANGSTDKRTIVPDLGPSPEDVLHISRVHGGAVVVATMNRPHRLNALNMPLVDALHRLLDTLAVDTTARVLVLAGAGRGFCGGADVKASVGADGPDGQWDATLLSNQTRFSSIIAKLRRVPQPIIAAVHGPATGGGMALALAADVRVAGESALFKGSFVQLGLSGGEMGTSFFLPRLVGMAAATQILMTGTAVSASRAEALGLVSRVVTDAEVVSEAVALAMAMVNNTSAPGLRLTKESLNAGATATSLEGHLDLEDRAQVLCIRDEVCVDFAQNHLRKFQSGTVRPMANL